MPLRRRNRNPTATTHSIVIFTKCPKEADQCIQNGINIEHRHYLPEKYIPQCNASNAKDTGTKQAYAQGKQHAGSVHKNMKPRIAKAKQGNVHYAKVHMPHGNVNAQHATENLNEWRPKKM